MKEEKINRVENSEVDKWFASMMGVSCNWFYVTVLGDLVHITFGETTNGGDNFFPKVRVVIPAMLAPGIARSIDEFVRIERPQ